MVRSIADVCDLEVVEEVLDSAPGFALLRPGHAAVRRPRGREAVAPAGRDDRRALGRRDRRARRPGRRPRGSTWPRSPRPRRRPPSWPPGRTPTPSRPGTSATTTGSTTASSTPSTTRTTTTTTDRGRDVRRRPPRSTTRPRTPTRSPDDEPEPTFWEQVGIDPIRIVTGDGELLTLRCYLDDRPVFLGADGEIDMFPTARRARPVHRDDGAEGNDLAAVSTWADVVERAAARELEVEVDPLNVYVLPGLDDDIAEGPLAVDPTQLEQAVELRPRRGRLGGRRRAARGARRVAEPGLAGVVRRSGRTRPGWRRARRSRRTPRSGGSWSTTWRSGSSGGEGLR